ncbi:MAG: poly-gamma-glutamate synthase PgsB [Calditrichia bacterium]
MNEFYLILVLLFLAFLGVETVLLQHALKRIPIRILVNGTRGKTTTTKILHQIFSQSNLLAFAKTTGDSPLMHAPDGSEQRIRRMGPARITENIKLLSRWAKEQPDAVLLECMALHPENQFSLSRQIFRPNYVILTNLRSDHQEVMGKAAEQIAAVLYESFEPDAVKFIPARLVREYALSANFDHNVEQIGPQTFNGNFRNIPAEVIDESWSLVHHISAYFKLNMELARQVFEKYWKQIDDKLAVELSAFNAEFLNLFSLNDPETTEKFINHLRQTRPEFRREIALLNLRHDRPLRTIQFSQLVKNIFPAGTLWITGNGGHLFKNRLDGHYKKNAAVEVLSLEEALNRIQNGFAQPTRVYGLANHKGTESFLSTLYEFEDQT